MHDDHSSRGPKPEENPALKGFATPTWIEKRSFRRLFYGGSLSIIIGLALALSSLYTYQSLTNSEHRIQQISDALVAEKKRFLRNAVERTLSLIEHQRAQTAEEHAGSGFSPEELEEKAKEQIRKLIRSLKLIDQGYIWVNHIVDYEGGDNYAIRAVHPNLPHTEGTALSTNMTDIKGNRPYEAELDGVKKDGELFFEYYFKKMDSDEIAHKMSFAKLYKPYDWVVATGVYLDDVDQLVKTETQKLQAANRSQLQLTLSISAFFVLLTLLVIVRFERHFNRLISNHEATVADYVASLEKLSCTDVLTKLFNRVRLEEVSSYEIRKAQRFGNVFSILLIDLDWFKSVNDTFGHQVGDKVLVETAMILQGQLRKSDTVGRWGGEEFLAILPETNLDGAVRLAEKIRKSVADHTYPIAGAVTCSIGVSAFRENDSSETMTERADRALYQAKNHGRNLVMSTAA